MNNRHELKFLCQEKDLCLIENRIRHICRLDANITNSGAYSIKSLYFDTYDNRCYYENQAGVDRRRKYRIRIYNNNTDIIKLECKYAYRGMKAKEVCEITRQQCEWLMKGSFPMKNLSWEEETEKQKLLYRFLVEKNTELLTPKVIVEYMRVPYVFAAGNVRITFDRAIRSSSQVGSFLSGGAAFRGILPEGVSILEVKYDEVLPAAISEMLAAGQELRKTSFSKYALCREYSLSG